jgi:hypothetical protein
MQDNHEQQQQQQHQQQQDLLMNSSNNDIPYRNFVHSLKSPKTPKEYAKSKWSMNQAALLAYCNSGHRTMTYPHRDL